MSYDRLVMCVDNSGSMGGDKINNSIKYLNEIARELNITTNYYKFAVKVKKIHGYNQYTLPADGSDTKIENCLNELFNNHLRKYTSCKTSFIFVTDAEDRISNVSKVISNKKSCEAAYGNKLHSYCLLTGASGGCSNELELIFGANSFYHVSDSNFKTILQKIAGGFKIANKVSKISGNIDQEIQQLTEDNNADIRKYGEKMNNIMETVKENKQKIKVAQQKIKTVEENLCNLNAQMPDIRDEVGRAHTDREVADATRRVTAQKRQYKTERIRAGEAGRLLEDTREGLQGETARADTIAKNLEENGDKIGERAKAVITNIIQCIKELDQITHGCFEQVKELKSRFTKDLDDLEEIVEEHKNLQTEFETIQESIQSAFTQYKQGRTDLDGFKQEIKNQMQQLNQLLDDLDSR